MCFSCKMLALGHAARQSSSGGKKRKKKTPRVSNGAEVDESTSANPKLGLDTSRLQGTEVSEAALTYKIHDSASLL